MVHKTKKMNKFYYTGDGPNFFHGIDGLEYRHESRV